MSCYSELSELLISEDSIRNSLLLTLNLTEKFGAYRMIRIKSKSKRANMVSP